MKGIRKAIVLAFVLIPIGIGLAYWLLHKEIEQGQPFHRAPSTYLRMWRSVPLIRIEKSQKFRKQVGSIQILPHGPPLTSEQKQKLYDSAYRFLIAYHSGNFDDLVNFRFPILKGRVDPEWWNWFQKRVAQKGIDLSTNISPIEIYRLEWTIADPERYVCKRPDGKAPCKNCWKQAGIKKAAIVVWTTPDFPEISGRNAFNVLMRYYSPPADTTSFGTTVGFYLFDPSPEKIVQRYGQITHAFFWVIVRACGDVQPYPAFCQWYWDPEDHVWLPKVCGTADVRGPKVRHYLIF